MQADIMKNQKLPAAPAVCELLTTNGEPVFEEPWQARTFAMAVQLNESGIFTWSEWASELSQQIAENEKNAPVSSAASYYRIWQSTLELLVEKKLSLVR